MLVDTISGVDQLGIALESWTALLELYVESKSRSDLFIQLVITNHSVVDDFDSVAAFAKGIAKNNTLKTIDFRSKLDILGVHQPYGKQILRGPMMTST